MGISKMVPILFPIDVISEWLYCKSIFRFFDYKWSCEWIL